MQMIQARFDQVNVVSGDPATSIAFYRLLGLPMPDDRAFSSEAGIFHAEAAPDEATASFEMDSVAFAQAWNPAWKGEANLAGRVVLGFRVDERETVDAAYDRLVSAGHPGLLPPHDAFWGARYAIVEDPDGIAVGIMSPASESHRSSPPTRNV
jgi:uncharacterized glyoxalase superfamily protein PhnB